MLKIILKSKSFLTPNKNFKEILSNITFSVQDNDLVTIIGPSGCGKTTLLRIIAGFDDKFDGDILFSNNLISDNSKDNKGNINSLIRLGKIGYIPQDFSLFPWLTIEKNILFGLEIKDASKLHKETTLKNLLDLVKMQDYRKYYPKEISGGMKQKIAICRAIATNPKSKLIVMDEPFSALDAQTRNSIQEDLLKIWKKQKLSIIFVTHNIDEAVFLSKRIIVLSKDPAKIQKIVEIDLPHPRDRTSEEFNQIRRNLLKYL